MKAVWLLSLLISVSYSSLFGQGLFDAAVRDNSDQRTVFEMNGYIRGSLFVGQAQETDDAEIKSGYGETSLKLRLRRRNLGDAYAEIRFRKGVQFGKAVTEASLREAYINAYIGPFDFRVGHQIVTWGRADGINPTDNITPQDMLARSPEEDDRRKANFVFRSFLNVNPLRIEAVWVPAFSSSVIPTDIIPLPEGISIESDSPRPLIRNSAVGLKINLELPSFGGSVSYFNGFNPSPGLFADLAGFLDGGGNLTVLLKPYRMHIIGADFSTTLWHSLGLRGEIAYRRPGGDYEANSHIPHPDFYCVLGIDREFPGNVSVVLQYVGRYVMDFHDLSAPADPVKVLQYELDLKNRLIHYQLHELSHSVSWRLGWNLRHQTLELEFSGLVNVTSGELYLKPSITYDISDGFKFILGGEMYAGPADTLFGLADSYLSSIFTELRISF